MRKLYLVAAVVLVPQIAHAECKAYDREDLKAMDGDQLKLEYCLNQLEGQRYRMQRDSAMQRAALELRNPMGASRLEIERQRLAADEATRKVEQCSLINSRILSLTKAKKINVAALAKECPNE